MSYEGALEFHNSLNYKLELINFLFLLILHDFIVFENLCNYRVELREGIG
jgi:hypothetical protein